MEAGHHRQSSRHNMTLSITASLHDWSWSYPWRWPLKFGVNWTVTLSTVICTCIFLDTVLPYCCFVHGEFHHFLPPGMSTNHSLRGDVSVKKSSITNSFIHLFILSVNEHFLGTYHLPWFPGMPNTLSWAGGVTFLPFCVCSLIQPISLRSISIQFTFVNTDSLPLHSRPWF